MKKLKTSHDNARDAISQSQHEERSSLGRLPSKIQPVYKRLNRELLWVHGQWNMYQQLFGYSEARIRILNDSAQTFFAVLQPVLADYIVLEICKLTDPTGSREHANLVITQLHQKLVKSHHRHIRDQLSSIAQEVKNDCQPLRERRNQVIAHNAYAIAMEQNQATSRGISHGEMELALKSIRKYMEAFRSHFIDPGDYGVKAFTIGDNGLDLVNALKQSSAFREMVRHDVSLSMRVDEGARRDA